MTTSRSILPILLTSLLMSCGGCYGVWNRPRGRSTAEKVRQLPVAEAVARARNARVTDSSSGTARPTVDSGLGWADRIRSQVSAVLDEPQQTATAAADQQADRTGQTMLRQRPTRLASITTASMPSGGSAPRSPNPPPAVASPSQAVAATDTAGLQSGTVQRLPPANRTDGAGESAQSADRFEPFWISTPAPPSGWLPDGEPANRPL
jgi:hypothetical protein